MNLLLWQVTVVACFAKLAFCIFLKSSPENIDAMQTLKDKEYLECPSTNPRISVYLPHPEDCSEFYICENKIPYPKKCPKGLHFNIKLKACDYPETAGCDKNAEEKVKDRTGKEKFETCPKKNSKFPVYLPDPEDCTRFFICDNGVPHSKKCFPGLHFNPKINACDYPKNAKCDDTDAEEKVKGRTGKEKFETCPKENSKFPVYLPDPEDCTRFFICDNGVPHSKKCFPGLHFNPKINACDYPKNAKCDTNADDDAKGRITDSDEGECPKENSIVPVYLPHPDDCNKFYICDNGSPTLKKCFSGLHFNPKLKACDFQENAGCDKGKLKSETRDNSLGICQDDDPRNPKYFPHPDDCSEFYICLEGLPISVKCPSSLHFNPKLNICDFPENAGCDADKLRGQTRDNSLGICQDEDPTNPKYFPHPDDCNEFYICHEGLPVSLKCPSSFHFNPKLNICDFPENAGCDAGVSGILREIPFDVAYFFSCPDDDIPSLHSHPTDCDKFYECNHGKAILKSCEPGLNFNEEMQSCDQAENTICEKEMTLAFAGVRSPYCPLVDGKIPIFYRHPTNCSIYYMCGHGFAYEFVCPARLHFNLRRRLCDYEENAKCKT